MDSQAMTVEQYKAEQLRKGATGWFWWIGALSVINSVLILTDTQFSFTFGLGIAQIGDALMLSQTGILATLGFFISFGSSGLFLLLAWLAPRLPHALPVGMFVYGVDALLFLVAQDWLGLGFHVFALLMITSGWRAYRQMTAAAAATQSTAPEEPNDATPSDVTVAAKPTEIAAP